MTNSTLSEMLIASITGVNSFNEGPLMAKEELPEGCVIVEMPESLVPFARVYGYIAMQIKRYHDAPDDFEPTEAEARHHHELHSKLDVLQKVIMHDLVTSQKHDMKAYSSAYILSSTEIALVPRQQESEMPEDLRSMLEDLFGDLQIGVVVLGRGRAGGD